MTNMNNTNTEIKAWIAANRYHGLEKDTADKTGLSKETVRAHFRDATPETKATAKVLETAVDLIQVRQRSLARKMARVKGGATK
jgi:hypothetical protein